MKMLHFWFCYILKDLKLHFSFLVRIMVYEEMALSSKNLRGLKLIHENFTAFYFLELRNNFYANLLTTRGCCQAESQM